MAFVLLPHLPKTHAHGATKWLTPEKALVIATTRGRWSDIFWFSVFHELGHLLLHGRRATFVEWERGKTDGQEEEANQFAAEQLIPRAHYDKFRAFTPTPARIRALAREIGIAPGIVVGHLQHDGAIPYSAFNSLREQLRAAA